MLHLSLDLFGTLIMSNPRYKKAREKVFRDNIKYRYGILLDEFELSNTIRLAEKMLDSHQEKTNAQSTIYSSIESILNMFLILRGKDDPNQVKISHIDTIYNELDSIWFQYPPELYPGVEDMLNYFADEGVTFNILSNTVLVRGIIIDKWLQRFKFYKNITFSLYSDIIGICKPDERVYQSVLERKPPGSKLYHVGDNINTDGACINSGILFVNVNNKDENKKTTKLLTDLYAQQSIA